MKAVKSGESMLDVLKKIEQNTSEHTEVQKRKVRVLEIMNERDELVMVMYKRKNLWSALFGLIGLALTALSTALVAFGLYYLPNETKMLFDSLLTKFWG